MGEEPAPEGDGFDAARCIEMLEKVRDECDAANRGLVAIHITHAIDLLEAERDTLIKDK